MFQLLLAIIYLAFISLGLPDALLGSAWPIMYQEFCVPVSYMGIISMIIATGTVVSSLMSDRLTKKLGTGNYTMNETLKFEPIGESMTGDMLVSTDGSRVYVDLTTRTQGMEASQIVLLDLKTQKGWYITPYKKPSADGKLGEYTVRNIKGKLQDQISPVAPVEGREFKQEWKGNDYTETQTTKATVISFVYKGNSSVPEYAELKEYNEDGVETLKVRVEYSNFKPQVDAKYLDFETILAKYDGKTGTSTVQAQEPSIASLILG